MAKKPDLWQTISLHPLSGPLDTRSRPADIPGGAFRWKQNFSVSPEGKLCRRAGHAKAFGDLSSFTNHDYHHQGNSREPVTTQFESTSSGGTRRYFIGTQSRVALLDFATGLYTDIFAGMGADGSRWKMAELHDTLIATNDVDDVLYYNLDGSGSGTISDLTDPDILNVSKARLAVQFEGFMLLMNVEQDGERHANRVIWSDLNQPRSYDPAATTTDTNTGQVTNSIAGFQDLDPGEIILNASPMLGRLYIYTNRGIWWIQPSGDATNVFSFVHCYTEPKNQTGCLAYENTLISTGTDHWYMGRDGIYNYNPYIPTPERQDWLHRASGLIYRKLDTQLDSTFCASPVGEYVPDARELWFSWPTEGNEGINNFCLVAQVEQKTADVLDTGYTSLVNFRRNPVQGQLCNEQQDFIGCSGVDWCLKAIGAAFLREYVDLPTPSDLTVDVPVAATYTDTGYNSILRGLIPLGLYDRDKIVRNVLIDHDTTAQDVPCSLSVRLGNHYNMVDPNDPEDICAPQWRLIGAQDLACRDAETLSAMTAKNLRPADGPDFPCYVQGRFIFFEITVLNKDGTLGIGGDTCLQRIDFDCLPLPKP